MLNIIEDIKRVPSGPCGSVVSPSSVNFLSEISEVSRPAIDSNFSNPVACVLEYPHILRNSANALIFKIIGIAAYPKIAALIIQPIMIYMVNKNVPVGYAHNKPVHSLFLDTRATRSSINNSIFSNICVPCKLGNVVVIAIIYCSYHTIVQDDFFHRGTVGYKTEFATR
jgi:hypothetical protein